MHLASSTPTIFWAIVLVVTIICAFGLKKDKVQAGEISAPANAGTSK